MQSESLIPKHGGYRNLKSFQVAQLVYDVTVRFADLYIERRSRTKDQMVQAARSGVQNIAEGSLASATSKKTEIKLTQVARASLEELKLDYKDFLRQKEFPEFEPKHPSLMRFKEHRCSTLEEVQHWIAEEQTTENTDRQGQTGTHTDVLSSACLAANGALSLLNLACYLLDRQVDRLARNFENQGGFTERLYKTRTAKRHNRP